MSVKLGVHIIATIAPIATIVQRSQRLTMSACFCLIATIAATMFW